jgi:cysteine-rich secretory family protein
VKGRLAVLSMAAALAGGALPPARSAAAPRGTGPPAAGPAGARPAPTQTAWLAAHNAVRAGTFPGVPLRPAPAPALPPLRWSAAAEAAAQAQAGRCVYAHGPTRGGDGTPRGENLAASTPGVWTAPAAVVADWAAEWADYAYARNACAPGRACGHYTQLVWRGTARIGCAKATCRVNSPFGPGTPTWDFYVCQYEPPGNWVGQRPY